MVTMTSEPHGDGMAYVARGELVPVQRLAQRVRPGDSLGERTGEYNRVAVRVA